MQHEMLNFLRNLHSYVAAQVLEVSWLEFQVRSHMLLLTLTGTVLVALCELLDLYTGIPIHFILSSTVQCTR
jgi:hypothetical protein